MAEDPPWRVKGKLPEYIYKRPDHLPVGRVLCINHEWYAEFSLRGKTITIKIRDDDAWNCDIEAGSKIWLQEHPDDGGWRVVWRDGMKRFVRI